MMVVVEWFFRLAYQMTNLRKLVVVAGPILILFLPNLQSERLELKHKFRMKRIFDNV